tara:strand:+ start:755 stop:994 length:240 start_codon:yes stop_codon:yes gene_type:complete
MGVKGSWWRGGWNQKYADNHERIFGKKDKEMRVEAKLYLEMWLSEQIPTDEWLRILQERKDVAKIYNEYLEEKKRNEKA